VVNNGSFSRAAVHVTDKHYSQKLDHVAKNQQNAAVTFDAIEEEFHIVSTYS
jgi:hypothetical protein